MAGAESTIIKLSHQRLSSLPSITLYFFSLIITTIVFTPVGSPTFATSSTSLPFRDLNDISVHTLSDHPTPSAIFITSTTFTNSIITTSHNPLRAFVSLFVA